MEIAYIDDGAFRLMKKIIPGPYTFVFEAHKKITKLLKASKTDKEVGIRFPPSHLCQKLLQTHNDVVISSHINHEMIDMEDDGVPLYSALIEDALGNSIDLIIDPGDYQFLGPTTVIDFTSGAPEVVREGIGPTSLFL
jgi:tRNA threonylcarbamoyl adenosine modification protein (Sua5/YciO/YrdC/YwlC family)